MRMSHKVFLCTALAGMVLAAAPLAMANGNSCTFTLSFATDGPCPVSDPNNPVCSADGGYTGIKYTNTGSTLDHAATLVTHNNTSITLVSPTGGQLFTECTGDTLSGLGRYSCHEKAVKINGLPAGQAFWIVVPGQKAPIDTSIVGKKCGTFKSIAIVGLGLDTPAATLTQTLTEGECSVEFTFNAATGTVIGAKLTDTSVANGCSSPSLGADGRVINPLSADALKVDIPGVGPADLKFGDGYFKSGDASCTTKVVGGKVYTFGKPCPQ